MKSKQYTAEELQKLADEPMHFERFSSIEGWLTSGMLSDLPLDVVDHRIAMWTKHIRERGEIPADVQMWSPILQRKV